MTHAPQEGGTAVTAVVPPDVDPIATAVCPTCDRMSRDCYALGTWAAPAVFTIGKDKPRLNDVPFVADQSVTFTTVAVTGLQSP